MSMEAVSQSELAEMGRLMLETLTKAQEEKNLTMRRELEQMQAQLNEEKLKQEKEIKEIKNSLQEVKQCNAEFNGKLDAFQRQTNQQLFNGSGGCGCSDGCSGFSASLRYVEYDHGCNGTSPTKAVPGHYTVTV